MTGISEWGTCLLLVTGASRGIGAAICEEFSKFLPADSVIIGLARTKEGLEQTKANVHKHNSNIHFISEELDLHNVKASKIEDILKKNLSQTTVIDRAILVHNVGSLGSMDYIKNLTEESSIKEHTDLNYGSIYPTTTAFVQFFEATPNKTSINIINITSLAAIQPIKATGMYCAVKAAREMMFKVLALEEPNINVLNYSPGPVETDMQTEIRECVKDPEVKSSFQAMKDNNSLVNVNDTVKKMISVLTKGNYNSGDHVDFFD